MTAWFHRVMLGHGQRRVGYPARGYLTTRYATVCSCGKVWTSEW